VLGVRGRADTVEELSELIRGHGVGGAELDPTDSKQVAATAAVELEASKRHPYRQLSRVFHLVGRKAGE